MTGRIELTHPDRVLFPDVGVTKQRLAEYYARIAPLLLPHLAGRPLSFVRCPEGVRGTCFYQKHWTGGLPTALRPITIRQADGARRQYVTVHNVDGLIALVQFGIIELHPWSARADNLEQPDRLIFDLDPAPGVAWAEVRAAARAVRQLLDRRGLDSWVKPTGSKGLHVVAPIRRGPSWDEVGDAARAIAKEMSSTDPGRYIATASKAKRRGRIFIDWLRNVRGATSVAPWSVRARSDAPISAPWTWARLAALQGPAQVRVTNVRIGAGDPWSDLRRSRQALPRVRD